MVQWKGRKTIKRDKGFTLLELLIVMAVIAILLSIAIPSFKGMQNEARKTKAQGDTRTIQIAIETYYKDYNWRYPAETNYQATLIAASPQMLTSPAYDPFGATSTTMYSYSLSTHDPATSNYYIVYSVGAKGTGTASVSNAGIVTASSETIWASNGHL
jgi:type II secretion system protein G